MDPVVDQAPRPRALVEERFAHADEADMAAVIAEASR